MRTRKEYLLFRLINWLCRKAHYRSTGTWVTKTDWNNPEEVYLVKVWIMIEDKDYEYRIQDMSIE